MECECRAYVLVHEFKRWQHGVRRDVFAVRARGKREDGEMVAAVGAVKSGCPAYRTAARFAVIVVDYDVEFKRRIGCRDVWCQHPPREGCLEISYGAFARLLALCHGEYFARFGICGPALNETSALVLGSERVVYHRLV